MRVGATRSAAEGEVDGGSTAWEWVGRPVATDAITGN